MIKVSIIITCHNLEKYIVRAVNSCLNQNFPEDQYEIIVVDDASTDNSREALSIYRGVSTGSGLIKFKFMSRNRGVAFVSNIGINMARGRYIVRVDGDDYIHRDFIKSMSEVLEWNPDIGFVHCDLIVIRGAGGESQRKFKLNTFDRLLEHGAGIMFRKKYLKSLGCYNEELRNCEDYDLILRYSSKYNGYHLRLPYYRYFKRKESLSSNKKERERIKKLVIEKFNEG